MAWDPQESIVEAEDKHAETWRTTAAAVQGKRNHGRTALIGHPELPGHSLELPLQDVLH